MHKITNAILGATVQFQRGKASRNSNTERELFKNLKLFKYNNDKNTFNKVFEEINASKLGEKYISANFFPKKIADIATERGVGFGNQFDLELRWIIKIFFEYKSNINKFVKTRKNLEKMILLEQFEEAIRLLLEYEKEEGVSLWLVENKIYLYSKLGLDVDKDIIQESKQGGKVKSILFFYKLKNNPNLGSRDYDYIVKRELQSFLRNNPNRKDIEEFFQYMIGAFSFEFSEEKIESLFKTMYLMPLVDKYIAFIDICEYIIATDNKYVNAIKENINSLTGIEDDNLQAICFAIDDSSKYMTNDDLLHAKDLLIEGKLPECLEELGEYIKRVPHNIEAISLYAKILSTMQLEENDFCQTINVIINCLTTIFTMKKNYEEAIETIYKIIVACSKSRWAKTLNDEILINLNPISDDDVTWKKKAKWLEKISCETLFTYKDIEWIEKNYIRSSRYLNFRRTLKKRDYEEAKELCDFETIQDIVTTLEACENKNHDVLKAMKISSLFTPFELIHINIFWDRLDIKSCADVGIELFVNTFIKNRTVVFFIPMEKYIAYCDSLFEEEKSTLTIIIFYYIYVKCFNEARNDDLVFLCEMFFYDNKIEKPSQICVDYDKYDREQLLFFLRYVCIQTIMGPILINMKTSKELDEERLEICQRLQAFDSENEKVYEKEIKDITHKLFINEGVQTLQNSKIEVNTEGIKTRILSDTKEEFERFSLYRSLQRDKVLEALGDYAENVHILFNFDSNQLFRDIVVKIRDAFISGNEYGLEGNLSMNIRHGILADQLRLPLLHANLIAVYDNKKEAYILDPAIKYPKAIEKSIVSIIGQLNKDTEEIINYLKKQLIQISTESKPTNGVFDYSLYEENFKNLLFYLEDGIGFEDYLDIIFTYLWVLTERNLVNIKEKIEGEISEKYSQAFTRAKERIAQGDKIKTCSDIVKKINEADIEQINELKTICSWFKRSETNQYKDFDLDLAFQIALKMIKNVHPNQKFNVRCLEMQTDSKIRGDYLKNYCDIFYILFDNVNAYAKAVQEVIEIRYKLKLDKGTLEIYFENDYDCSGDLEEQKKKMEKAKEFVQNKGYLAQAKKEGGSGIPKICKIINIYLSKTPTIELEMNEKEDIFYIIVKGEPIGRR